MKVNSMSTTKFLQYLLMPVYKPGSGLRQLIFDRRSVAYASLAIFLLGLLYSIALYSGYRHGFGAVTPPALNISAAQYYLWEAFFGIPVYFATAILFAGTARLLAMAWHGQGSFELLYAMYGLFSFLPMFILLWLPEAALMIFFPEQKSQPLGGFALMPAWLDAARQILSVLWTLALLWLGVRQSERLSWASSLLVTLLGFIPTSAIVLIFIR